MAVAGATSVGTVTGAGTQGVASRVTLRRSRVTPYKRHLILTESSSVRPRTPRPCSVA